MDAPILQGPAIQESAIQPQWITSPEQLKERIASWMTQDLLAIDTEFMRTRTYYALPGLIQIADQHGVYLIDPLQVTDLRPLGALLRAPRPLKVMHSMTEDILLLHRITGEMPVHVYDTQIAETFLGASSSLSFQRFVQQWLGILLDKKETRSDWLARPLSDEQILYAAQDVVYLLAAVHKQLECVREKNVYDFVLEECDAWIEQIFANELDVETAYLKVRGAWELSRIEQRVLKQLVMFRDKRAKEKDVPKPWIMDDMLLIQIARRSPNSIPMLQSIRMIKESTVRRFGETILLLVQAAIEAGDSQSFEEIDRPVSGRELEVYKRMKALVEDVEQQSGFSAALLAPKKQIEPLLIQVLRKKNPTLTPFFEGWRRAVIGDALLALLLQVKIKPSHGTMDFKDLAPSKWIFCSVFKSSRKKDMYVYVERRPGCEQLPDALSAVFGEPNHVMDMVLTPVKKLARADAREVLEKIAEQGFYLQMPPADGVEIIGDAIAPKDSLHG